jgi:outer membrane immunogenic protein
MPNKGDEMKKSLLGLATLGALVAGPAMAADMGMPLKAPPAPVAPVFSWTGFYIGGNVGGSWGDVPENFIIPPAVGIPLGLGVTTKTHPDSIIGGVQLGYNYQINNIVLGVEADFDDRDGKSTFNCPVLSPTGCVAATASPSILTMTDEQSWLGTFRGRLGFAWDHVLLYGTGGLAYGEVKHSLNETQLTAPGGTPSAALIVSDSVVRTGWAAGGGIQYAFNDQWSIGVEYLHVDLGSDTLSTPAPSITIAGTPFSASSATFHDRSDIVRATLDYRFNWGGGAIATRY